MGEWEDRAAKAAQFDPWINAPRLFTQKRDGKRGNCGVCAGTGWCYRGQISGTGPCDHCRGTGSVGLALPPFPCIPVIPHPRGEPPGIESPVSRNLRDPSPENEAAALTSIAAAFGGEK